MAIEMVSELSTKHVSYTSYLFDKVCWLAIIIYVIQHWMVYTDLCHFMCSFAFVLKQLLDGWSVQRSTENCTYW